MNLAIIVKVQQTSVMLAAICLLIVWADGRPADSVPYWYLATVIVPLIVSVAVLVIATLFRIWW